ncbi:response regulator [Nitrospira sp. Kam-Ns4a]
MPRTILIVDDCATTRRLVGLYLKPTGCTLLQAENGLEALEKLAQGPVDLIITDMNMPRMDGIALTRSLKQDRALEAIPVLMLTTEDADKERETGLAAGAAAYLTKPVSQERLVGEVRRLLPDRPA